VVLCTHQAPTTHREHHHTDNAGLLTSPRISTEAEPFNGLLFLNVAQVVDLVPVMGRLLEIQVGRGGLHIADQFLDDFRVLALQEERGATHVGTVVPGRSAPHRAPCSG